MIPVTKAPPTDFDAKIQWIKDNKHVCIMPYNTHHMQIEFDGQRDINLQQTFFKNSCCCNLSWDKGLDTVAAMIGHVATDVKTEIAKGKRSARCQVCYDQENQTGSSERTMSLLNASDNHMQTLITDAAFNEFNIRIKFSNLCNLACRSCSPTFSSRYAQLHGITVPAAVTQDIGDDAKTWSYVQDNFEHYLGKYEYINLTLLGGESLIQPGAIKLLQWLEQKNVLDRINLCLTSNFTNFDTKIKTWLGKFNRLQFAASIDSVHENFEYVRSPANFQTVINNLLVLDSMKTNQLSLTVQPLINLNNIYYVTEILDFWQALLPNLKHSVEINPVTMFRPYHMTVQNLPLEYRESVVKILEQAVKHPIWQTGNHGLEEYLKGLLEFAKSTDEIYNQFELYLYDTVRHDHANKISMQQGNKKFYDCLTTQHKRLYEQYDLGGGLSLLPADQQQIYFNLPL